MFTVLTYLALTLSPPFQQEDSLASFYFTKFEENKYSNYEAAKAYLDSGILILRNGDAPTTLAEFLRNKGILLKNHGELQESLEIYDEAIALFTNANDSAGIAAVCNNIGISYFRMGRNDLALPYYFQALDINTKLQNFIGLVKNYNSIGNVYASSGHSDHSFKEALKNYLESAKILEIVPDQLLSGLILKNIGNVYNENDSTNENFDPLKAIEYWGRSIKEYRAVGDSFNIAGLYNNIGVAYENQGEFVPAAKYIRQSISLQEKMGFSSSLPNSYFNLGNVQLKRGNSGSAFASYEKSYKYSSGNNIRVRRNAAKKLSELHADRGETRVALNYLIEYDSLDQELYNTEKEQIINNLTTQYETERKEKELALTKAEVDRRTAERDGYLVALAVFLALAIVLVWIYSQRQKAVQSLRTKEKDLHNRRINELLLEQEVSSLNAMLDGQENERKRISQELHDRVGSLLTAAKYAFEGNGSDPESLGLLDNALEETRTLSHSLASGVLAKFGLVAAISDLKDSIESERAIRLVYETKGFEGRINQAIEIDLYRILQELVSNTLKYASAQEITIRLEQTSNEVRVLYADDGKGFNPDATADGIGLKNIEARSKKYNGQLAIESQPTQGMQLTLTIELLPDEKTIASG